MTDIIITEYMDDAAVQELSQNYDVIYDPELVDDRPRLLSLLADARALVVRNRTQVDHEIYQAAPRLNVVGRLGVGLDNIDLDGAAAQGIAICPAAGANADSVAEYVLASMLLLLRPVYHHRDDMMAGAFPRAALSHGHEIGGKTLTIIGGGVIGRAVMTRAMAMGMNILVVDPVLTTPPHKKAQLVSLDEGFAQGDVISLHLPLTDGTRDLINASALQQMKPTAILINTARGGIVDHEALGDALRGGRLGGAAIDVFPNEPAGKDNMSAFRGIKNIILTPHVAGLTEEANLRVGAITVQNLRHYLEL